MRHYGLFWGEFGADLVGVKYCSHTLLLHAWVSVRRVRAHPEAEARACMYVLCFWCTVMGEEYAKFCRKGSQSAK